MKIAYYILYSTIICILLGYIAYLKFPTIIGFGKDGYRCYKLKKDIKIIDPRTKRELGYLKRDTIVMDPSFSDAIDLGDTMTLKINLDIDNNLIDVMEDDPLYTVLLIK